MLSFAEVGETFVDSVVLRQCIFLIDIYIPYTSVFSAYSFKNNFVVTDAFIFYKGRWLWWMTKHRFSFFLYRRNLCRIELCIDFSVFSLIASGHHHMCVPRSRFIETNPVASLIMNQDFHPLPFKRAKWYVNNFFSKKKNYLSSTVVSVCIKLWECKHLTKRK